MCGIAGFLTSATPDAAELTATATCMASALETRGPDDAGVWVDAEAGIAFGNRRLAIIDLSAHGHQSSALRVRPVRDLLQRGNLQILELREELEWIGHRFRRHSERRRSSCACRCSTIAWSRFAWQLPMSMKIQRREAHPAADALSLRARELIKRPKMGFAIPPAAPLRGPLRDANISSGPCRAVPYAPMSEM
jgi:hypothetical protein